MQEHHDDNVQENIEDRTANKMNLANAITWTFLGIGSLALIGSFILPSSILAFIGLGLVFWGAILAYIQPEKYMKKVILDSALIPPLETMNKVIQELNYKGKAIYLPPKYFKDPETSKVYISKQKGRKLPKPGITLKHENQLFIESPRGILMTPPGAQLSNLFEKRLDKNFFETDLDYVLQNIPRLIIRNLELAENIEIETQDSQIKIRITGSAFKETNKENNKLLHNYQSIGSPLSSAIACALTKTTGNPITIENIQSSEEENTIETTYQIIGKTESPTPETPVPEIISKVLPKPLPLQIEKHLIPNMVSLLLTTIGSIFLAQVAWVTFYDMTFWGKDIVQIFFGPRTGQAIGLGVGMQIIHYFILGFASFFSGIFTYFRNRSKV